MSQLDTPGRDATAPADPGPEDMPAPESTAGEPHGVEGGEQLPFLPSGPG